MKLRRQSPVGNRVSVTKLFKLSPGVELGLGRLQSTNKKWIGSGTMALAAAVLAACERHVGRPKVLVSAYGCPDVVSAIIFAGAEPKFVDLDASLFGMSLKELESTLSVEPDICAVVAVDLFGLSERGDALKSLLAPRGIALIQDCAQSLQQPDLMQRELYGDLVTFSFGRGKPVYLGGGGCLIYGDSWIEPVEKALAQAEKAKLTDSYIVRMLKMMLYNTALSPLIYPFLSLFLGRRLGTTNYRPLGCIRGMDGKFELFANTAIESYWSESEDRFLSIQEQLLRESRGLISIYESAQCSDRRRRLLRLPLIVENPILRNYLVEEFTAVGISATRMYEMTLPEILKRDTSLSPFGRFVIAEKLANQLVTIPCHARMGATDVHNIGRAVKRAVEKHLRGN